MEIVLVFVKTHVSMFSRVQFLIGFAQLVLGNFFPCYNDIPDLSHVKCVCFNCRLSRGESGLTLNFNPFNLDSDDNFNAFDDSMCDTLNCANTILQSCSYYELVNRITVDDSLSKFYFNNIDGFKSNFNESLINIKSLNCVPSLIAFCETNLDEDDIHDFNMTDYNVEHLYAIPGKKKGSGLSIFSHKTSFFAGFRLLLFVINSLNALEGVFKLSIKS